MLVNVGFNELRQKQVASFFYSPANDGGPECVLNGISDIWFDESFQCALNDNDFAWNNHSLNKMYD